MERVCWAGRTPKRRGKGLWFLAAGVFQDRKNTRNFSILSCPRSIDRKLHCLPYKNRSSPPSPPPVLYRISYCLSILLFPAPACVSFSLPGIRSCYGGRGSRYWRLRLASGDAELGLLLRRFVEPPPIPPPPPPNDGGAVGGPWSGGPYGPGLTAAGLPLITPPIEYAGVL